VKLVELITKYIMEEGLSQADLINKYSELKNNKEINVAPAVFKRQVQKTILHLKKKGIDTDTSVYSDDPVEADLNYTAKIGASRQRQMDENRELRKLAREDNRLFNALSTVYEQVAQGLKEFNMGKTSTHHKHTQSNYVPVIHISDLHFGEVIDLPNNKYNYDIASRRLKLFAEHTKKICKAYNCSDAIIAMTGDSVNASHVLSKIVLNADSQARIVTQATFILKEFILDLNQDLNIGITAVVGNESRVIMKNFDNFQDSDENLATNSFDYILFNMLKLSLEGSPGISFMGGNFLEKVIKVNGQNVLLTHGTNIGAANPSLMVNRIVAAYAKKGIILDHCLFGHIHSPQLTDSYSRSGGLPGSNGYSESKSLIGKASQNLLLFGDHGDIQSIAIDLQNVELVEGYEILPIDDNLNLLESKRSGKVVLEIIT